GYLAEYLLQRGVRNIKPALDEPAAPAPRSAPAAPPPGPRPAESFSTLLRGLVESSASDPEERSRLYSEALQLVKQCLDRQVDESTKALSAERDRSIRERGRTESVLAAAAEGKVVGDKDGNVVRMNPAAEEISGRSLPEMAG